MAHVAVNAWGRDQPGIAAAVTAALSDAGCNLEDTSMTILRGHFAMMLMVRVPDGDIDGLTRAVEAAAEPFELIVSVRPIDDDVPESPDGDAHVVSVYGADRPGIVASICRVLATHRVNIVDLSTRIIGDPSRPVYAMVMSVTVPAEVDVATVANALDAEAAELGVDASIHADDADVL